MISKPDTLDIRGEGGGRRRAGRNGAKIETHRGERYKWDAERTVGDDEEMTKKKKKKRMKKRRRRRRNRRRDA